MDKHEYLSLFEKHLAGKTSPEEEQLLKDHQDDFELAELEWNNNTMGDKAQVREMLYQSLQSNINAPVIRRINYKRWSIAAAILVICSAGLYYTIERKQQAEFSAQVAKNLLKPIVPGSNRAVLTLSDGSSVTLGDSKIDPITDGTATISNQEVGVLVYNNIASTGTDKANLFNTVSTPRGGQQQIILPDGTKVWLNASSSLNFPTYFSGKERHVQLTGEAYFEVAKNARMPFKVDVKGMAVKVLGTHFNIMAYDDEQTVNTTLLEGAVEIANAGRTNLLKPGQQATLKKSDGSIRIENVNTAEFVAWKNGNFMFTDEDIEIIMRKIGRWYDVDVDYKGNLTDKAYVGYISRYENVTEVLKMLELTGTIHFKVEGRRITVMP